MEQNSAFEEMYAKANQEQKTIIDTILLSVQGLSSQKVFCLSAHAGCGKTFVQKAILCKLRSLNISCLPCAFSGIVASLRDGAAGALYIGGQSVSLKAHDFVRQVVQVLRTVMECRPHEYAEIERAFDPSGQFKSKYKISLIAHNKAK